LWWISIKCDPELARASKLRVLTATCNETFVRVPPMQRLAAGTAAPLPLLGIATIVVLSGAVIFGMQRQVLARYSETAGS
jgi:hypothetical protein